MQNKIALEELFATTKTMRDLVQPLMTIIVRHYVGESERWQTVGPLYDENAPLVAGDVDLTDDAEEADTPDMTGDIRGSATDQVMQALGRHGNRPAHVHFFIEAPDYRTLTTQINFGDETFAADFTFGTREGLLPVPNRQGDSVFIAFDFTPEKVRGEDEHVLSDRERATA